jgi:hypothetical protein
MSLEVSESLQFYKELLLLLLLRLTVRLQNDHEKYNPV